MAPLMADADVARWHANLARGSRITADVYVRRLGAFLESTSQTAPGLLELNDRALRDLCLDYITSEEAKGRAGAYIASTVKAVKSWLAHGGKALSLPLKIKDAEVHRGSRGEQVPTREELRQVLLAAPPGVRVAIALMAYSGVRPGVLGNYLGTDGLRVGDLPDLKVKGKTVVFGKTPALVVVRPELSKIRNQYLTFLAGEGCEYLKAWLEERIRQGERIGPATDLIHPARAPKAFITTVKLGDAIRRAIRAAGYPWRPYILRAYFDTQLLLAESKGKVAHDYRVFWMGHRGSMESRYTTDKQRLPEDLLEDMREAYRRCEPHLCTTAPSPGEDGGARVLKLWLQASGLKEEEIRKLDLAEISDEELLKLLREHLGTAESGPKQQVVPEAELPRYLAEGWVARMPVNGSKFVVERP